MFTQLQYFQENKERLGIIVDEYGEVQGLVTLDDIIEEMIGDFTTSTPGAARGDTLAGMPRANACWKARRRCATSTSGWAWTFPLDGPKTVNGLLLELLQEIPESPISLKVGNCVIEVVQVQNQAIKVVKLLRPAAVNAG